MKNQQLKSLGGGEPLRIAGNVIARMGGNKTTGIGLLDSVVRIVPTDSDIKNSIEDFYWGLYSNWVAFPTGQTIIKGNTIYNDAWGWGGILLNGYVWPSYVHWIEISYNTIGGLYAYGVYAEAGSNPSILIKENKIYSERYLIEGWKVGSGILLKRGGVIEYNEIWDFYIGIQVGTFGSGQDLLRAELENNRFRNNVWGIDFNGNSREVNVTYNCIENNSVYGINIRFSAYYNNITYNYIYHNGKSGVEIGPDDGQYEIQGNRILYNNITNNGGYGVRIDPKGIIAIAKDNRIYYNNFIDNGASPQAYDEGTNNQWDDGYPSGGNYWSDFSPTCIDEFSGPNQDQPGSDGICDDPYIIDSDSQDNYPFKDPFDILSFSCGPSW